MNYAQLFFLFLLNVHANTIMGQLAGHLYANAFNPLMTEPFILQAPYVNRLLAVKPALNALFYHSPVLAELNKHFFDPVGLGIDQYPELTVIDLKQLIIFSNLKQFNDDQKEVLLLLAENFDIPGKLEQDIKDYKKDFKDI